MMVTEEDVYDYLEHFGVKGMRWGVRRSSKELNRISRQKDKEEHSAQVEKARERLKSGEAHSEYKVAKSQYKKNKEELGSREARKILNEAKDKKINTINKANEYKNGKEFAKTALVTFGAVALITVAASKLKS